MRNEVKKRTGLWPNVQKFGRATVRFFKQQQALLPARMASTTGLLAITIALTLIIAGYQQFFNTIKIRDGIVQADIVAPRDFSVVDEEATERLREQAGTRLPPVFEYYPHLRVQAINYLNTELEKLEQQFLLVRREQFGRNELTATQLASPAYSAFLKQCPSKLNNNFCKDEELLRLLAVHNFNSILRQNLVNALDHTLSGYIYATTSEEAKSRRVIVRNTETGKQQELRNHELLSLPDAEQRLRSEINAIANFNMAERERVFTLLKPLLNVNLRYSESLTNAARAVARLQVTPISFTFRQNQIIARRGDPVSSGLMSVVKFLQDIDSRGQRLAKVFGLFIIVLAVIFALKKFSQRSALRQRLGDARAFSLVCFTLIVQTLLIQFGLEISRPGDAGGIRYEFLIPYAGSALIMAFLLDTITAQVCTLIVSLFTGLMSGGDLGLMVYAVLSGTAATYGVERYRQRNSITRAAIIIALTNALATVAVLFISNQSTMLDGYLYNTLYGIGGGLLTAAFVSVMIPINESLFDILTDVKLLELSNMELPLLRELSIHAPGTQQHSMLVSSLAEAAAEAIDANSLLVRVGCYYHDIGKLMAPDMFVENQAGCPNPHDAMEPKRSASVIIGHVKKGILMGQEAGLPRQIIDLIPQHHGTRRLHYFYNKALEQVSKTGEPVNEDHYRYPGPKPQTPEAAIVMLADCAEASARSLDDPTPENIRAIIKRITDDVIADGQLEECELTMREFNQVRESLTQTLCNIYHHRIKYPGFNTSEEEREENAATAPREAKTNAEQRLAAAAGSRPRISDTKKGNA
ncbi:MAG: HDIG domain-containing metalloprotein [Acidobacteriota bacterium]